MMVVMLHMLCRVAAGSFAMFAHRKHPSLPEDFWEDHIVATFVQTLRWWIKGGLHHSPEAITEYFHLAI
jgi:hypothetical protein